MRLYRPVQIGSLFLSGNLFLAPVAGYTDRAFRSVCLDQGADFTFTELVSSEALTRNPPLYNKKGEKSPTELLLSQADNEKKYGIQLFGADADVMYRAASLLSCWKPALIDINAGCPVPKVVKTGAGSALMKDPARLGRVVEAVVRASAEFLGGIPVSVKMRSGWDAESINYLECARIAVESGAAMISLHARTRTQGYGGKSRWDYIGDLVSRVSVPAAGSGDLFSPEDAEKMLRETNCSAILFARGAMGDPFIFSNTRSFLALGAYRPPPFNEKIESAFRQLRLLCADAGEKRACREMRKQFCAYTKGAPHSAELRNRLVQAESIDDYKRIFGFF
jgi:nifR3 family TIM-barrel protein